MQTAVIIAISAASLLAGLLLARHFWKRLVPPAEPPAPAPWDAWVVFVAVVLYLFLPEVVALVLHGAGFFTWWYGPNFPIDPKGVDEAGQQLLKRGSLWIQALATPLVLGAIAALLAWREIRPREAGLISHRPGRDLLLAVVACLVVAPLVYGIYALTLLMYERTLHPLETAVQGGLPPADWVLLFLVPVVCAPLLEELFFRGLLQGWMLRHPGGPDVGMVLALVVALVAGFAARADGKPPAVYLGPLGFVLLVLPAYLALPRLLSEGDAALTARAVVSGALVFGLVHAPVWPSPVPLFALGLVLGWLAHRTRGLLAPMMLHALFNAVGFVGLLFPLR